jgi:hypothetical protein
VLSPTSNIAGPPERPGLMGRVPRLPQEGLACHPHSPPASSKIARTPRRRVTSFIDEKIALTILSKVPRGNLTAGRLQGNTRAQKALKLAITVWETKKFDEQFFLR